MSKNNKTINITFGAIVIALFTILVIVDRQTIGMLSGSLFFLFPIPFIIYSTKVGFKNSIAIIITSTIMALIFGNFATNFIAISGCLIGTIYGTMQYHKKNKWLTIGIVMFISIFVTIASVTFLANLLNTNMMIEIEEIQTILKNYDTLIPPTLYTIEFLKKIYIFSTILVGIFQGIIIYSIGQFVNKKTKKILIE